MDGQPVWLASVSVARDGRTVGAADLDDAARDLVKALLWEVMAGATQLTKREENDNG